MEGPIIMYIEHSYLVHFRPYFLKLQCNIVRMMHVCKGIYFYGKIFSLALGQVLLRAVLGVQ